MGVGNMRVIDGVHGDTSDHGPLLLEPPVLVVDSAGLEDGLVGPASSGDDS